MCLRGGGQSTFVLGRLNGVGRIKSSVAETACIVADCCGDYRARSAAIRIMVSNSSAVSMHTCDRCPSPCCEAGSAGRDPGEQPGGPGTRPAADGRRQVYGTGRRGISGSWQPRSSNRSQLWRQWIPSCSRHTSLWTGGDWFWTVVAGNDWWNPPYPSASFLLCLSERWSSSSLASFLLLLLSATRSSFVPPQGEHSTGGL